MAGLPERSWEIDPSRSRVAFEVRHLGVAKVKGSFGSFAGTIDTGPAGLAAAGTVGVGSVETGDRLRDSMLRGGDFFDEQAYPEIAFSSTGSVPAAPTPSISRGA